MRLTGPRDRAGRAHVLCGAAGRPAIPSGRRGGGLEWSEVGMPWRMGRHELSTALRLTGDSRVSSGSGTLCSLGPGSCDPRRSSDVSAASGRGLESATPTESQLSSGLRLPSRRRPGDALRIACSTRGDCLLRIKTLTKMHVTRVPALECERAERRRPAPAPRLTGAHAQLDGSARTGSKGHTRLKRGEKQAAGDEVSPLAVAPRAASVSRACRRPLDCPTAHHARHRRRGKGKV